MVEHQIKARGIHNKKLLDSFLKVERHFFVPESMISYAYEDGPLGIGKGQTISQPYMVAIMIDLLDLKEDDVVLEIGTGSGYQTALLAEMAKKIYSIERIESLAISAQKLLKNLGYNNIFIQVGDGTMGWQNRQEDKSYKKVIKFNAIIISAAAPEIPEKLVEQLSEGGRMVLPYGKHFSQELLRITKKRGKIKKENFGGCMFVPLIGQYGWKE